MTPAKEPDPNGSDHSPVGESNGKSLSHRSRSVRNDNIARFGEPPAPPPQQPLPEKPDHAKSASLNPLSLPNFLKRTETTKPSSPTVSPSKSDNAAAEHFAILEMVKKDLDSQRARVKELEDMLQEEKSARLKAEERAHRIEQGLSPKVVGSVEEEQPQPDLSPETEDTAMKETADDVLPASDTSESELQQRLDNMVLEMQKMKTDMEQYQQRAETAEADATKTRESLAQMIERLRQENEAEASSAVASASTVKASRSRSIENVTPSEDSGTTGKKGGRPTANGHVTTPKVPTPLEHAVATVLRQSSSGNGGALAQSAPYVSMLGVVLIGVGLMAYLNSWQKTEK